MNDDILRASIEAEVAAAIEDERASIAAWLVTQPVTLKMLGLSGLAKCIARGDHARLPARPPSVNDGDDPVLEAAAELGIPLHRDHDDFEEGTFLVQGARFKAGVTGRLRDR